MEERFYAHGEGLVAFLITKDGEEAVKANDELNNAALRDLGQVEQIYRKAVADRNSGTLSLEDALVLQNSLLEQKPDSYSIEYEIGLIHNLMEQYEESATHLERALQLCNSPYQNPIIEIWLGSAYKSIGDIVLEKSEQIKDIRKQTHLRLTAFAYYQRAENYYIEALDTTKGRHVCCDTSSYFKGVFNFANLLYHMGRPNEAAIIYSHALQIAKTLPEFTQHVLLIQQHLQEAERASADKK